MSGPLHITYRPQTLSEIRGNKGVVSSLKNLLSKPNMPHAFLFHGPSGTGKTSMGRIIAKTLGCKDLDITEVNAASNRGIDYIREVIRNSRFKSIGGGNKVYIFDEAHSMTTDAGNALLKIVEDAPKHTYFIFCTTNPEKMLPTLINRCYPYEMEPLTGGEIIDLLMNVMEKESIELDAEIIRLIAEASEGIPRCVLVYLGMVSSVKGYDEAADLIYKEKFQSTKVLDLCKQLLQPCDWKDITSMVQGLDTSDYDKVRQQMVSVFGTSLLKATSMEEVETYNVIMSAFVTPLSSKTQKGELVHRISTVYLMINGETEKGIAV